MELDAIRSNRIERCAYCGIPITRENDSGWEIFIAPAITQVVCAWCDSAHNGSGSKAQTPPRSLPPLPPAYFSDPLLPAGVMRRRVVVIIRPDHEQAARWRRRARQLGRE